jgi:hypothetical protein
MKPKTNSIFHFRTFSSHENFSELPSAIFILLEVLISLVFLIGSVLNSVLVAVFFRRRGFRTSISNRYAKKNGRGQCLICLVFLTGFQKVVEW